MSQEPFNPQAPLTAAPTAPEIPAPAEADPFEGFEDSYAFGGTQVYTLPDGKQSISFQQMNEGMKARFQRLTNRDIKVDRKTDQAVFRPDQAADRHALILTAVTGWDLYTRDPKTNQWSSLQFNDAMLRNWLQVANPKIVQELEDAIRKANPWLNSEDATEEDLEEQIQELTIELDELRRRNAGKA